LSQDGTILNINKRKGISSFDVVRYVRKVTNMKKVGHAGTLDPLANGVLLILVGRGATKQSSELMTLPKTYETTIRLGMKTPTLDLEGEVQLDEHVQVPVATVQETLARFEGDIEQVPPMYSAKRVGGRRLYKIAKEGRVVEREPARVRIHQIELLEKRDRDIRILVRCSKGTYIRSLARDIGSDLDTHGTVTALTRTAVGDYSIDEAIELDQLESVWNSIAA
jgi:tRNA pseudouridine55 synthase